MSNHLSLAERFINVMLMKERARRAVDELNERPSGDPRFTLGMVLDAQENALVATFAASWETFDRIRQVAEKLHETPTPEAK